MSPKIIEGDVFKNRRELAVDDYKDLLVDGGTEKVKTLLCEKWKHSPEEITAVPSLTINNTGRLSGAKWYIVGKITKDINIRLNQLNLDAKENIYVYVPVLQQETERFWLDRQFCYRLQLVP